MRKLTLPEATAIQAIADGPTYPTPEELVAATNGQAQPSVTIPALIAIGLVRRNGVEGRLVLTPEGSRVRTGWLSCVGWPSNVQRER